MKTIIVLLLLLIAISGDAQTMHLDTTFNGIGYKVYTGLFGSTPHVEDLVVREDGKILISGYMSPSSLVLFRVNVDGSIDTTFSDDGYAFGWTNYSLDHTGSKLIIQPDGKILTVGAYSNPDSLSEHWLTIWRFEDNGTPDTGFGEDGRLSLDMDFEYTVYINDLALQPDGKIIFAANDCYNNDYNTILGRLNNDGTFDETFGDDGYIVLPNIRQDDEQHTLLLQMDGKIILGGLTSPDAFYHKDILVYRINPDGTLDLSFADAGSKRINHFYETERISNIIFDDQQNIFIFSGQCGGVEAVTVHKLLPDGSFDLSYGTEGTLTLWLGEVYNNYIIMNSYLENKIIFGGGLGTFRALRLLADGAIDSTFFDDGEVEVPVVGGDGIDMPRRIVGEDNGNIVVAGYSCGDIYCSYSILRFTPDIPIVEDSTGTDTTTTNIINPVKSFISITPNPSKGIITINSGEPISQIELINLNGEILRSEIFPGNSTSASIQAIGLASGIYLIKIYNLNKVQVRNVMISG